EKHPQVKRVALISPNDTSGKDTNTAVVKALKGLGFEVAADEYYERGTKDFYPILTKMLATKPDMLDVAAAPAGEGGLLLKQGRQGLARRDQPVHDHRRRRQGSGRGRLEPDQYQREERFRRRHRAPLRRGIREALQGSARCHRRRQLRGVRRDHQSHAGRALA